MSKGGGHAAYRDKAAGRYLENRVVKAMNNNEKKSLVFIKRMLVMLLCMGVMFSYPSLAFADNGNTEVTTYEQLKSAVAAASGATTLTISADIVVSEDIELPAGANITLVDKSGQKLSATSLKNIKVPTGSSLTLDGGLTLDSVRVDVSGTFTMTGGTIQNCEGTKDGGGVIVNSGGTMSMKGGTISKCTATLRGGGIYSEGKLTIDGGTITENATTYSGSTNSCLSGAGIAAGGSGTLTIKSGNVTNNTSVGYGGGILVYEDAVMLIEKATITGNKQIELEYGTTYTFVEKTAPEGYTKAKSITFRLTDDGALEVKNGSNWDKVTGNTIQMIDALAPVISDLDPVETTFLTGTKTLTENGTAKDMTADQFKFTVKESVSNGATATGASFEPAMAADGKITFITKKLKLETAGTYKYTISEVAENNAGYTYDKNSYTVTYTVSKEGDKLIASDPIIQKINENGTATDATTVAFENTYKTPENPTINNGDDPNTPGSTPDSTSENSTDSSAVSTGDESHTTGWALVILASLVGIGAIAVRTLRRKEESE